ncbi:hypothetical protein OHA21_26880 [Actinoplanes sp. NBC_00393]
MLLGGSTPAVAALDRALGGLLLAGTAAGVTSALSLFDAKTEFVRVGQSVLSGLRDRLHGLGRLDRTERLQGAHTVIVVTAFFEVVSEENLPFDVAEAAPSRADQVRLARAGTDWPTGLLAADAPSPSPEAPYEAVLDRLNHWYARLADRLVDHLEGLAVWERLNDTERNSVSHLLRSQLPQRAVERYEILYRTLAVDVPEFDLWTQRNDDIATRAEIHRVRQGLRDLETLLVQAGSARPPDAQRQSLALAYRAALDEPIVDTAGTPRHLSAPTLGEIYIDPSFVARAAGPGDRPGEEDWWDEMPPRDDLSDFLAGRLTTPQATSGPLILLGHPGAGKSSLVRVLAARLPAADFLPVRVPLRDVPADLELQDQIEYALRAATGLRIEWPELSAATNGALPVLLLDGFDELLQATGVSQSDFLERVAAFQRREAIQQRPVSVLVTSRTAVIDRARLPEDTLVVRLEPFTSDHVDRWLAVWNEANEAGLHAVGLRPFPADLARRYADLASQPLLLLMLALYDAQANDVQRIDGNRLDVTGLYERLMVSYALREVAKDLNEAPAGRVEAELMRLSAAAFAMFNRSQQWVTEAQLDADLTALELAPTGHDRPQVGFRSPLTVGQELLGRFFFLQRAQAIRGDERLRTYEFLHATFGEYLVARLTVHALIDLRVREAAATLPFGRAAADEDLLYSLLSFAPLTAREAVLPFLSSLLDQSGQHAQLAELAVRRFRATVNWTDTPATGYRPASLPLVDRHALYAFNLLLLALTAGPITAAQLFPGAEVPADEWRRWVGRWQATISQDGWSVFIAAVQLRRTWLENRRDVELTLIPDGVEVANVDPYWGRNMPPGDRAYYGFVHHMESTIDLTYQIRGEPIDDVLRHALEPAMAIMGLAVTSFAPRTETECRSVAHTLIALWLASDLREPVEMLIEKYDDAVWATTRAWPPPRYGAPGSSPALMLLLRSLRRDSERLPPGKVFEWSQSFLDWEYFTADHRPLLRDCLLAVRAAGPEDDIVRQELLDKVDKVLDDLQS